MTENMSQIIFDEGIKAVYDVVFNLDVDQCVQLDRHPAALTIMDHGKRKNLESFLKSDTTIVPVTVEVVSTKDLVQKACGRVDAYTAFFCEDMYLELQLVQSIIKLEDKPIGYASHISGYNGLGKYFDPSLLMQNIQNSNQAFLTMFSKARRAYDIDGSLPQSGSYNETGYGLSLDFLADHPVQPATFKERIMHVLFKK